MTFDEYYNTKLFKESEIKEHFQFVKELKLDAIGHKGCYNCGNDRVPQNLKGELYTGVRYCVTCGTISFVDLKDRIRNGAEIDMVRIYNIKS